MAEKVTQMLLKVDLDCYSCYKKIKKTLCKFPQIRDQIYDEKNNTVKITVVCCSPEKIRDKLCCRGGSSIKSIEILELSKPKAEKPKESETPKQKEPDQKPKQAEKPKEAEKPKDNGKPKVVTFAEKPKEAEKPKDNGKPKDADKPKEAEKPKPKPKEADKPPQPAPQAVPMPVQPPAQPVPTMMTTQACPMDYYSSCGQCYGGGCPCCRHLYGMPAAPPPYDNRGNVYGYPYGNGGGGGGNGGYYGYNNVQRCNLDRCCDYYVNEENPNSSCAIM